MGAIRLGLPRPCSVLPSCNAIDITARANTVGHPLDGIGDPIVSRLNRYFNTAAFAFRANYTQGTLAPRIGNALSTLAPTVRMPGANNLNLVFAKTFYLTEKVKLDFRACNMIS